MGHTFVMASTAEPSNKPLEPAGYAGGSAPTLCALTVSFWASRVPRAKLSGERGPEGRRARR
jgi:hypothetical protein